MPNIVPQKVRNLVSKFSVAESIFELSEQDICSVEGIDHKSAKTIRSFNKFDTGKEIVDNTIYFSIKSSIINLELLLLRSNFAG